MQLIEGRFIYSASDLNHAIDCAHLSELDRLVALGERERPEATPTTELLARKGEEHEERQLARLRMQYSSIVTFSGRPATSLAELRAAEAQTFEAMAAGVPLIYQATFFDGTFLGRADFLRRIERPSAHWAWSYEAIDSKLALTPKPTYLIQLANYSEHLTRLQGSAPYEMHVLLGSGAERSFRLDDYAAYYRGVKTRFLERMQSSPNSTYPFETSHCTICPWNSACARRRSDDDHLSLVARIRRDQISKLESASITTMTALGDAAADAAPRSMQPSTFETLRAQAALQSKARATGRLYFELIDGDRGGFELLPAPDEGDVFFDMEGDPLYSAERGLEYLFGAFLPRDDRYVAFWARDQAHEQRAFEAFVDFVVERRARYPNMHLYHYASYEAAALRRLMGYYGTREAEVNDLLRNEVLVDLYTVTRQSVRVSQPSYSIKKLEPFYGMARATGVQRGDDSIVMFESWLSTGDDALLEDIERYNNDDCRSTHLLLNWLLERRAEREQQLGTSIPWREHAGKAAPEETHTELAAALLQHVEAPNSLAALRKAPDDVRARWILGNLLDFHEREDRPVWWKLFDRFENIDRLLDGDHEAIAGLALDTTTEPVKVKRSWIYTYTFPEQHHNLGSDEPYCPHAQKPAGNIVSIDEERNRLEIKLSNKLDPNALTALIPGAPIRRAAQREALERIAAHYLDGSLGSRAPATLSILAGSTPRFRTARPVIQPDDVDEATLSTIVADLDESHLVIQGPPGTGKSTLGAAFIVNLLASGKRVAIVSNGHKAIHNLLAKIEDCARSKRVRFRGLQKYSADDSRYISRYDDSLIATTDDNKAFDSAHDLAAGTSWLIARDRAEQYDYLIVDEAGQMSLADALACSAAARNVVLLGDPLQLAQVSLGSHPLGTDVSVLEHLLAGAETIPPERGIFLERSYRMAPPICDFISHGVYEDRLCAAPICERNELDGGLRGSGLFYVPVVHDGNARVSDEEAQVVAATAKQLLTGQVTIGSAPPRSMSEADILVVAPYNAQRKRIRRYLASAGLHDVAVGTVDKFQGQEAPVVMYSMATSSGATMPRDLEFLFEKNRLNVAISRAQCASILVCSPELLSVRASTPEQMSLVNLLCAFVEAATRFAPPSSPTSAQCNTAPIG